MDILEIVANRPITEKPKDEASCPFCESKSLSSQGTSTTLLGWLGTDENKNPNHVHERWTCLKCSKPFMRETKTGNVWYTQDHLVLKGIPSCFEKYHYTCAKCCGVVKRLYTKLDGVTEATSLGWIWDEATEKSVKQYRTFYQCIDCKHGGETEHDYWQGPVLEDSDYGGGGIVVGGDSKTGGSILIVGGLPPGDTKLVNT